MEQQQYLEETGLLLDAKDQDRLMLGDFNTVMDTKLDYSSITKIMAAPGIICQ